jgi:uncharacterized YigZ family protein
VDDTYLTIEREARAEIKVKGSRFIAESFLTATLDDALARLESVRKREFQATHHCYAYIVGKAGAAQFKYSDDGEPSGTAGKPIYDLAAGRKLTNVLIVVTRYYGGTKLGTGGLAHAYSDSARAVLDESGVRTNYLTDRFHCTLDFPQYDSWQRELHRLGAQVVASQFTDRVSMVVEIRRSRAAELAEAFVELTSGKGRIEKAAS